MWHYTEGLRNWNPIWTNHGIRILPGPASLWLDATGKRLPPPLFPGFDTLGTLEYIMKTGYDYSWFVLEPADHQKGVCPLRLRAESRSDQQGLAQLIIARREPRTRPLRSRHSSSTGPISSSPTTVDELVKRMNEKTGQDLLDSCRRRP